MVPGHRGLFTRKGTIGCNKNVQIRRIGSRGVTDRYIPRVARYSAAQIYAFALEAGFDRDSATTMTAIALAESGGRGSAHATHGEDSRGLWQINARAHPGLAERYDLFDPRENAKAAFEVSGHGGDISPWTTTHGGGRAPYLRFREQAQAAAVAHGDPGGLGMWAGTEGYGDHRGAGSGTDETRALDGDPGDNPFEVMADDVAGPPSGDNPFEVAGRGFAGDNPFEVVGPPLVPAAPGVVVTDASASPVVATDGVTEAFVEAALDQAGDRYVFGAPSALNDADPSVFDCSELVRWAGHRAGVDLPDGSWAQFLDLKRQGLLVPVEEGIGTRGALLFSFSSEPEPGGPRPSHSHVAISLGNGSTIEARGRAYGVDSFDATTTRFDYAALLPGAGPAHDTAPDPAGDALDGGHEGEVYGSARPVSLDTDAGDGGSAVGHGLTWADGTPGDSPGGDVLQADPFTVDSDPERLTDSLGLLFGDGDGGQESLDGLAGPVSGGAGDPLDDAVTVALEDAEMTPFDGFESDDPHAAAGAAWTGADGTTGTASTSGTGSADEDDAGPVNEQPGHHGLSFGADAVAGGTDDGVIADGDGLSGGHV
jgi:cell wall-associated NlpC family hydrolase